MAKRDPSVLIRITQWVIAHNNWKSTKDKELEKLAVNTWQAFAKRVPVRADLIRAAMECIYRTTRANWGIITVALCQTHSDELFGFGLLKRRILDALGVSPKITDKKSLYGSRFVEHEILRTGLRMDLEPVPATVILGFVLLQTIGYKFHITYQCDWLMSEAMSSITGEIENYKE